MAQNGFVDVVPQKYPRSLLGVNATGVSVAIYANKHTKQTGGAPSLRFGFFPDVLAKTRWRAGDRVWFQLDPARPRLIRVRRTDGSFGSKLTGKSSLEANITIRAFGGESSGVPSQSAQIVSIDPDAIILELPVQFLPALGYKEVAAIQSLRAVTAGKA